MRLRKRKRWRMKALNYLGDNIQLLPVPIQNTDPVIIYPEEFLAWKLYDIDKKSMDEIGFILGASRVSISNLIKSAREKVLRAILEKRPIIIGKKSI